MNHLKPSDIDHIIKLIEKITDASTKSDFLTLQEQQLLNQYQKYEWLTGQIKQEERLGMMCRTRWGVIKGFKNELARIQTPYDADKARMLKNKLSQAQKEHFQSIVPPLQEQLDLYLTPRWPEILKLSAKGQFDREFKRELESYFIKDKTLPATNNVLITISEKMIRELKCIKAKLEYEQEQIVHIAKMASQDLTTEKPAETEQTNAKSTFLSALVSFLGILAFILCVHRIPITWLKDHPHGLGLQGSIIFLIPCLVVGYFKPKYRKCCWGAAALSLVVLILSLI